MKKQYLRKEFSEVKGTTKREKLLYYFNNYSRFESSLRNNHPNLYSYFIKKTKFLEFNFKKSVKYYEDYLLYVLMRFSKMKKYKEMIEFAYNNKYPLREIQLKLLKFEPQEGLTRYETAYSMVNGSIPRCKICNNKLKFQMYSDNKNKTYCSTKCQDEDRYNWANERIIKNSDSILINYQTIKSTMQCKCGNVFTRNTSNIFIKNMMECNQCSSKITKAHLELSQYISQYTEVIDEAKLLDNNRQSVDIYLPEFNLCIEYDGLMYHSYGRSNFSAVNKPKPDKTRHLRRTEELESKGVQLLRIWEHEWLNNKEKWYSIINSYIGVNCIKVPARKTSIKIVPSLEVKEFYSNNHMQGFSPSSINIGLYYGDILVSCMSFGRSIRSKNEYELLRFCSKINHIIIGGASKLLKYFEVNYNPDILISYANRRWSQGNVYEKLGFEFVKNTEPNYFYLKNEKELFSRLKFTKKQICKLYNEGKLKCYDSNKTELENMYDNKFRVIYDCGSKKYIKYYNKIINK